MPRIRRSGINNVEDPHKRYFTLFNHSNGLFKTTTDLSTLTGARAIIVIESNNGKVSAFGTPSVDSTVDSFLFGNSATNPFVNEKMANTIRSLQNKLLELQKRKAVNNDRIQRLQERSSMSMLIYGNMEDLGVDEVRELLIDLSLIQREIEDRKVPLQPFYQLEIDGHTEPSTLGQSSLLLPESSRSQPLSLSSQSCVMNPTMLLSSQAPEIPYLQHIFMLQWNSMLQVMPQHNESQMHNNHLWGMGIDGKQSFSQSAMQYSPQIPSSTEFTPQPPLLQNPLPHEANLSSEGHNSNLIEPSQNHANSHLIVNSDELSHFSDGIDGNIIFSPNHTIVDDKWPSYHI
ncbi:hypothetical protein ACP4OV_027306 [Aristida adscensionis]